MVTTDYTTMSDTALEAKRNEIQVQIEGLRFIFMEMGRELERRRQEHIEIKDYPELKAEIVRLQTLVNAQKPKTFLQRLFSG